MSTKPNKLTEFATAVGKDIKEIKGDLSTKLSASDIVDKVSTSEMNQAIATAKSEIKNEILGDGVPEELDTLKEIAESLRTGGDTNAEIVRKLAELGGRVKLVEDLDPLTVYQTAKSSSA